jgi:TonB family protein
MNRSAALTALALLAVMVCPPQPNSAQTGTRKTSTPAQYVQLEEEILKSYRGGVYSEHSSRWDAQNFPMPRPVFPEEALKEGAQGTVVLSFYRYKGKAALIKVVESPHPALTQAAIDAVRQWRWLPFNVGGKPFPILTKLSFIFVIEGGEGRVSDPEDSPELKDMTHLQELRDKAVWPEEAATPQR